MTRLLVAAAAAALAVPAVAQVAQTAPHMTMRMGPMADGAMTLAEAQDKVAKMFARHDANKDGVLTKDEMAARKMARKEWAKKRAEGAPGAMADRPRMDPNAMFDRLDSNRDGMISRDEFAKGHEMRVERRIEIKNAMGDKMKMHHGMGMMGGHMFAMADTNKDGRVTLAEAQATVAQHFAMADTNRDGKVTRDEMKAMHEKMGGMKHHG